MTGFLLNASIRNYQLAVKTWYDSLFRGTREEHTTKVLCMRFMEEAMELAQAVGLTQDDLVRQMRYTYSRPKGEVPQEIAGVMLTLQHVANDHIIDIQDEALAELERVDTPEMRKIIYDKQEFKRRNGLVA